MPEKSSTQVTVHETLPCRVLIGPGERVVAQPYPNPRSLTVDEVTGLLDQAW